MAHRPHSAPSFMAVGYDPHRDLPTDHLARLVEFVVERTELCRNDKAGTGQPSYDPKLCAKVMVYGYATGTRSSRQLERMCNECLPYLFLTRGDTPSYRTLCSFRVSHTEDIEKIWLQLFAVAGECGLKRLGRIVIDSSKFRADASSESVVKANEYQAVLDELKGILQEASDTDAKDEQDPPGQTLTGQPVETAHMREILRRVRKKISQARKSKISGTPGSDADGSVDKPLGPMMLPRIEKAIETLEEAQKNEQKHACLTDPDARMMGEGRDKNIKECHSFEAAVDTEDGLLVVGQSSQSNVDNPRLTPVVEAAKATEPGGVKSVDADSGYYSGDMVAALIIEGVDVCIPDSNTACDMKRGTPIGTNRSLGQGSVHLEYDADSDCYLCPEGNRLLPGKPKRVTGQILKQYRAERLCVGCPLAEKCLTQPNAKRRIVKRGDHAEILETARQQFSESAHQDRYHHRGEAIETVFAFIRAALGYSRWMLRGNEKIACEAKLFSVAYQLRKVHIRWSMQNG